LIINGGMEVAQRGTSFAYNSFGGAGFSVDRYWFYNSGGAISGAIEQSTDVPAGQGFTYSLFNNTNGAMPSGTNVELTKQGSAGPFYNGGTYTLSFWVKGSSAASSLIDINWRNSHANGANSTIATVDPTFDVTTSWNRIVKTFILNSDPHSNNRVLDFEWSHKAGMKITGVQLEAGEVATPFEHRSYGEELALCQRYYQVHTHSSATAGQYSSFNFHLYNNTVNSYVAEYRFSPNLRAGPTVTFSGALAHKGGSVVESGTFAAYQGTPSVVTLVVIPQTDTKSTHPIVLFDGGSAKITFDAEL
jgi:hypothetical protein